MKDMKNQIIPAMDMSIPDGMKMMAKIRTHEEIYGYKFGSLWILERGVDVLRSVSDMLREVSSKHKIILDMQKWGTDTPDIVTKQVNYVAPLIDEAIVCPMGGGRQSLRAFADACINNTIKPICVLEMTQPESGRYLRENSYINILDDAIEFGISDFVIPATKEPKTGMIPVLRNWFPNGFEGTVNFYATGFKAQGGQTKPMVDFGVTKFIVGRAVYEAENPIQAIEDIYKEINGEFIGKALK